MFPKVNISLQFSLENVLSTVGLRSAYCKASLTPLIIFRYFSNAVRKVGADIARAQVKKSFATSYASVYTL